MTPEEQQILVKLLSDPQFAAFNEQQGLLGQQQQQNDAFMQPRAGRHATGSGAALAGLGDALRQGFGGYQQSQLAGQQQAGIDKLGQARGGYQQLLAEMLRGQQQPQGPEQLSGPGMPSPF